MKIYQYVYKHIYFYPFTLFLQFDSSKLNKPRRDRYKKSLHLAVIRDGLTTRHMFRHVVLPDTS